MSGISQELEEIQKIRATIFFETPNRVLVFDKLIAELGTLRQQNATALAKAEVEAFDAGEASAEERVQSLTKQNSVLRELLKKVHAHLNDGPLVYFKEDDADSPPTDLAEAYQESELWEEITSAITPYKADYLCPKCKVNFAPKKCLCQSCEALEAAAPSEKGGEAK